MHISTIGKNHVTCCTCCNILISNQAADAGDGIRELEEQLQSHLNLNGDCRVYYQGLPKVENLWGIMPECKIEADNFLPAGTCPKCGSDNINLCYCNGEVFPLRPHRCPECQNRKEHMIHHCQRCNYEWYSPTLDSRKEAQ